MHILLSCVGTMGDLMPVLATGRLLAGQGHQVEVMANDVFEDPIRRSGLAFFSLGGEEAFNAFVSGAAWQGRDKGWAAFLREGILPCLEPAARRVEAFAQAHPGDSIIVPNNYSYGARWAARALSLPLVNLSIQPAMLRGLRKTGQAPTDLLPGETVSYWRGMRAAEDYLFRTFGRTGVGATAGLRKLFKGDGPNSPDDYHVALFPNWFHGVTADWPENTVLTGFPLIDTGVMAPLPDTVSSFLGAGAPPVALFCGSFMRDAAQFFEAGLNACRAAGRRGLIICRYPEDLPDSLPEDCLVVPAVPFGSLFPKLAGVIHHGGIGTVAQSMAAGIPQLVFPLRFEQPDNAYCMERLGVGRVVPLEDADACAADALGHILTDRSVTDACAHYSGKMAADNPFDQVAAAILDAVA